MPLRDDILDPIPGDNPAGIDLRRDNKLLIYETIKESRRQDDDLAQGDWVTERKVADYSSVVQIAQDSIATLSKDLQLAGWLTEALLLTERFGGMRQGLDLSRRLVSEFWDTVYPVVEDGDLEMRATPLNWMGYALDLPLRSVPLVVAASYSWLSYHESRMVGYEEQAKTDKERNTRTKLIEKEKKLAPETFDKAFANTPKTFYAQAEKDLDGSLFSLDALEKVCDEKFEKDAPSFSKLRAAIDEVRRTVHLLLEKKREKEPDTVAVEVTSELKEEAAKSRDIRSVEPMPSVGQVLVTHAASASEPADHREAIGAIIAGAAVLRRLDPLNPAPYLMLRGLRWGELRNAAHLGDSIELEAPPTELRQRVKRLALAARWLDLLEACEEAMGHPSSRAWLDLQRLTVAACHALGEEYSPIALAVETGLRALLSDSPQLLDATLLDDTPAANPETRAWLLRLVTGRRASSTFEEQSGSSTPPALGATPTWLIPASDAFALAKQALAAGKEEMAFAIMRSEIARQRSGRGRFRRMMQLVELAVAAGKDAIAQPLMEDLSVAIEEHKLDSWEDPEVIAGDLLALLRLSKKVQGSSSDKQKLFERICRLDPVLALGAV